MTIAKRTPVWEHVRWTPNHAGYKRALEILRVASFIDTNAETDPLYLLDEVWRALWLLRNGEEIPADDFVNGHRRWARYRMELHDKAIADAAIGRYALANEPKTARARNMLRGR